MSNTFPINLAEDIQRLNGFKDLELLSIAIEKNLNQTLKKFKFSCSDIELLFNKYKGGYSVSELASMTGMKVTNINDKLIAMLVNLTKKDMFDYLISGEEVYNKLEKLKMNRLAYLNSYSSITDHISIEEAEALGTLDGKAVKEQLLRPSVRYDILIPVKIWVIFVREGITTIDELLKYSVDEIKNFRGIEEKDIKMIMDSLKDFSSKAKEIDEWIKNND